jgi:Bacterial regulatory proteins, luxR family
LSRGKTNRYISEILGMKPHTVNKHLEQTIDKLGWRHAPLPPRPRSTRRADLTPKSAPVLCDQVFSVVHHAPGRKPDLLELTRLR